MEFKNGFELFKYDEVLDAEKTFDINLALNNNWNKIIGQFQKTLMEYHPEYEYLQGDLVFSEGKLYVSQQSGNIGQLLTDEAWWKPYGKEILDGGPIKLYSEIIVYNLNSLCYKDGVIYRSKADGNTGHDVTDGQWWETYGGSNGVLPDNYVRLVITISSDQASFNPTGVTVTASKGADTITAICRADGKVILNSQYGSGTYTITLSNLPTDYTADTKTQIAIGGMSYDVQFNLSYDAIPVGSTVIPVNDCTIWLKCADIPNPSGYTLSQVLSNSTLCATLMASSNAIDYMIRSTGAIMLGVVGSGAAMTAVVNNIAYDSAFDDITWRTAMLNSPTALMAMDSVAVKVPTMTSDTTPNGVVAASSVTQNNKEQQPFKAFDGVGDGGAAAWYSYFPASYPEYIQYDFTRQIKLYKVELMPASVMYKKYATVKDFLIQGSNDGLSFYDMLSGTATNQWDVMEKFIVNKNIPYRYIRLKILSGYDPNPDYTGAFEIQFYGKAA